MSCGSGIVAVHPVLEALDQRTAMNLLARNAFRRSQISAVAMRRWFVRWPAIPQPVLYFQRPCAPVPIEACAA